MLKVVLLISRDCTLQPLPEPHIQPIVSLAVPRAILKKVLAVVLTAVLLISIGLTVHPQPNCVIGSTENNL